MSDSTRESDDERFRPLSQNPTEFTGGAASNTCDWPGCLSVSTGRYRERHVGGIPEFGTDKWSQTRATQSFAQTDEAETLLVCTGCEEFYDGDTDALAALLREVDSRTKEGSA